MLVKYLLSLTYFLFSTAPVEDHVFGYLHSVLDEGLVHLLSREEQHSHSGTTHTHTHTYTVALLTHTHARTRTHTHTHTPVHEGVLLLKVVDYHGLTQVHVGNGLV